MKRNVIVGRVPHHAVDDHSVGPLVQQQSIKQECADFKPTMKVASE